MQPLYSGNVRKGKTGILNKSRILAFSFGNEALKLPNYVVECEEIKAYQLWKELFLEQKLLYFDKSPV